MQIKVSCYALITIAALSITTLQSHARNCIKGKPCGNGCIAKQKTCRIDNPAIVKPSSQTNRSVIRRTVLRLPKVYQIVTEEAYAREAPDSAVSTGYYKQGQRVFVYKTSHGWARISNMQPEEWLELHKLQPVDGKAD
ncbi:MAG: hypothetical protein N0E59_15520 [Candidatus Thiodiazotropha taylori]|nr:hypothetical protein [Candidatus Thiodiazotropha taylori]MCG8105905.1 hypothetical protein [Candidatus Thiodiazotropha taylori]MCG8112166.1 hypothetical protein [Candidatus Thiodiazotropha taylori]MCW4278242.1 hypothetical protein [Candidatus Thiodiazotropha taylori]MCW4284522.1 hypothetical protein [Candidatus Thiodiazotropha taylori]